MHLAEDVESVDASETSICSTCKYASRLLSRCSTAGSLETFARTHSVLASRQDEFTREIIELSLLRSSTQNGADFVNKAQAQ
jgi:hypothetical protein